MRRGFVTSVRSVSVRSADDSITIALDNDDGDDASHFASSVVVSRSAFLAKKLEIGDPVAVAFANRFSTNDVRFAIK